ncbi:MAG: zinc-binding dehydrogenase, partial [Pontimonas sp.]|nr:zinc-binding dehydrogenase [Pontimonas sp.]
AKKLGADHVVGPDGLDALLKDITGGKGANVVIEATGNPAVMAQALEIAAFKGRVGYIGIDVGREAPAKLGLIQSKELTITGSIGSPGVWPDTLRFMANKGIDLSPLVTSTFEVDNAVGAVDAAQDPAHNIKAHIRFSATL